MMPAFAEDTDDAALRTLIAAQAAAWTAGDASGYASTAGDDLSFTNIRGQHWTGRDAFVTVHERIFNGMFAGSVLDLDIEHLSFPGTDVAVVEMAVRLSGASGMPPGIAAAADGVLRTRLLEVFERRGGVWTLIACHNTAVTA